MEPVAPISASEAARSRAIALQSTLLSVGLVLALYALALAFPVAPPNAAFGTAVVLVCAIAIASGRAMFAFDDVVRVRWPRRRWPLRLGVIATVIAISAVGPAATPQPLLRADDLLVSPILLAALILTAAALACVLASLLEWIERSSARMRRLRTRLILLGLIAAAATLLLYAFFTTVVRSDTGRLATLAWSMQIGMTAAVVWGIAQALARPMASRLEQLSCAVHEVSRGNLDVHIEASGRDELAGLAQALKIMVADLRRYVTPAVLFALRRHQERQITSERRDVSILFIDVRGFTALSESIPPEDVILMIDFLFERMIEIVEGMDGYINRFTGDGMMVVFGAPADRADHARAAIDCAVAMQAKMRELNANAAFAGRQLEIGIGVNTGPVVAGAVGNADREEYTLLGDCVNVASRLCSSAGGGEILIGAATAAAGGHAAEALPPLTVKGKSAPLEVYRVAA